jgi:ABC-type glycerol-3-phosphate transport system permease component
MVSLSTQKQPQHRWTVRLFLLAGGYAVLIVVSLVSLYPAVIMLLNSFKSNSEILINPGGLPIHWTLANYANILYGSQALVQQFWNSVLVTVVTTLLSMLFSAMAAFAFAKYRFPGRNILFLLLLATIMVPMEITLPPQYLLFAQVGWINTYQVQILPFIVPVFGVFLLRQYMLSIPDSLLEAARLDGANEWLIFWRIMVPIARPALAVFGILQTLSMWNSYLWPQVMANDTSVAPLMVILPNLRDTVVGFLPVWGTIMAGCVLATLPILILFLTNQERFMQGVVTGAIRE